MKKITKVFFSLLICSVFLFGNHDEINVQAVDDVKQVMPDLSNYEVDESLINTNKNVDSKVEENSRELIINPDKTYGLPPEREIIIPDNATPSNGGGLDAGKNSRALTPDAVGTTQTVYDMYENTTTQMEIVKAAEGTNVRVFVKTETDSASGGYDGYEGLKPTGDVASANAQEIADEFDAIYSLFDTSFGQMAGEWNQKKVNVVLYDVGNDGNGSGGYTAGFFTAADLFASDPPSNFYTNEDSIVYMDIGRNQGWANFIDNNYKVDFYATLAHEYQHLINGTHWVQSDLTQGVSTWYNEGLSGLAAGLYYESKAVTPKLNIGEYAEFTSNSIPAGTGYVPTNSQWASSGNMVYALYGSSNILMQDFYENTDVVGALPNLVSSDQYGYDNSKCNVAINYSSASTATQSNCTDDFNNFFTRAMLNFNVDSPTGPTRNTVFNTDIAINTWSDRVYFDSLGYDTYTSLDNNVLATNSSSGASYYSNVFLTSESVGTTTDTVEVTIPANTSGNNAEYYIVTPSGATGVNTVSSWVNSPKIVGQLQPGVQAVTVGTDNMFSIVAINTDSAVNQQFKYRTVTPILESNDTITFPETGATPQSTITETTEYSGSIVWKDAQGNVVSGSFATNIEYSAEITLTAKDGYVWDANPTINIDPNATLVSWEVSSDSSTLLYIVKFPKTTSILSSYEVTNFPNTNSQPTTTVDTEYYSGTIVWKDDQGTVVTGTFETGMVYTAEYSLTAKPSYIWSSTPNVTTSNGVVSAVAVSPADTEENTLTFTVTYEAAPEVITSTPVVSLYVPITGEYASFDIIQDTDEYTVSISYSPELVTAPNAGMFEGGTVYTATVTFEAKDGYLWDASNPPNVELRFYNQEGRVETITDAVVSGDANNLLTFSYTFPKTTSMLNSISLDISAPVDGSQPQTTVSGVGYTGTIEWLHNSNPHTGVFVKGEVYTAVITLTTEDGYEWEDTIEILLPNGTIISIEVIDLNPASTLSRAVVSPNPTSTIVVTAEFPAATESSADDLTTPDSGMVNYYIYSLVLVAGLLATRKYLKK